MENYKILSEYKDKIINAMDVEDANSIISIAQLFSIAMCHYYKPKNPLIELYFKSKWLSVFYLGY